MSFEILTELHVEFLERNDCNLSSIKKVISLSVFELLHDNTSLLIECSEKAKL